MNPERIDNKKRRILKKLYLAEFAVKGFEISCETNIKDFDQYDLFIDGFVDFLEVNDLCFAGGGFEVFEGFICGLARYGSVTQEQMTTAIDWLNQRSEITSCQVSGLLDANYL
ncbi:YggL family protein [Vibrio tapetis subsp. quintayensis]|uniref:YggL 50S ribosome-binding family protein n=1 Tax=Vibrio tapetis TaxID=52443 RepID=UPI0025B52F81|nr:YggL family protein [Vibrio tapetis]MDN3682893.1 YggL family protein [Vibrio tapetis subsp. quintayensis]